MVKSLNVLVVLLEVLIYSLSFLFIAFFSFCFYIYKYKSIMKVIEKINKAEQEGRPFWSFEYFPPKTSQVNDM